MTNEPLDPACERRSLCFVPLAAAVAILPLLVYGCSCGHDIDFHLGNWIEAARQLTHGTVHPQWDFTAAYNAGEPRFVFYPPISWYLGALLGLLLTHIPGIPPSAAWTAAPTVFVWLALTASGVTMYRLARRYASPNASLLAATLYLANPYMLFTAYERSAYAELLAAAWIPLLFDAALRRNISIPRVALPIALLWLTDVPAAIFASYALAFLAAARLFSIRQQGPAAFLQLACKTAAGFALGLGIAAFYIIPAAVQRRFVQLSMAITGAMHIDQNFLFAHTGTSTDALLHDQVLHTASVIAVVLLVAAALALTAAWLLRKRTPEFPMQSLAVLTAGIALLLTPLSTILWKYAPEANLLQFPWRLLVLVACVLAVSAAAALSHWPLRLAPTIVFAISLAALLTTAAYRSFRQSCDPEDTAPALLAGQPIDPTDEYTPAADDNDVLQPNAPPYWLATSPAAPPTATNRPGPAPLHLSVIAPQAEYLILNLRDYPAWRIRLNGAVDPALQPRDDGRIALAIPAGNSVVDIRYAHTWGRPVGDTVTLLALALFAVSCRSASHAT